MEKEEVEKIKTTIQGELEIDHLTGTIYFHTQKGRSILRIQGLPAPILKKPAYGFFDVRYEEGSVSWTPLPMENTEETSVPSRNEIG